MPNVLYYVHDPMCSWCWGFRPTLRRLRGALPGSLELRSLLGGLAPDTDEPMTPETRLGIQDTWRRIQKRLPDIPFNFDFWRLCEPRRSTYPACRAVIAAREQSVGLEEPMILAIQTAYYLQARNPSDVETLAALATELGLDPQAFRSSVDSPRIRSQLLREIELSRSLGVDSFPRLVLVTERGRWPVPVDYLDVQPMLETIRWILD